MINGFLLIDKDSGMTSFKIVSILRKALNIKRIGFAGTLDPLATGFMIVAVGEATKLLTYLEKQDKVYEAEIELGAESDTYDADGKLVYSQIESFKTPEKTEIIGILEEKFSGEIQQKPPIYSAIQIGGQRAYALARKGLAVELKSRQVKIYEINIISYAWPILKLKIHCSSGTYIRSIAHDIGIILGCGGYIKNLRRIKISNFSVKDASKLDQINSLTLFEHLQKPAAFLNNWQMAELTQAEYGVLALGNFILNRFNFQNSPILGLFQGETVGVLEPCENGTKLKFLKKFNIV